MGCLPLHFLNTPKIIQLISDIGRFSKTCGYLGFLSPLSTAPQFLGWMVWKDNNIGWLRMRIAIHGLDGLTVSDIVKGGGGRVLW